MSDEPKTIVIARTPNEWQATLLVEVLREHGIDAEVAGVLTSQFRAEAPGLARVIISSTQVDEAHAALEAHRKEVSEIDWEKVDVGEEEGG